MTEGTKKLDKNHYEESSYEMRLLVLRNSLLAVYRHSFFSTVDREYNQRERNYSIYSTQEETLKRLRNQWNSIEKTKSKEVILFPEIKSRK